MSERSAVMFAEDEDIYIDCRPVDEKGEVILSDKSNKNEAYSSKNEIINNLNSEISTGNLYDNIGIQSILAITFMIILYNVGKFVFKDIPKKMIDKHIENN